MTTVELLKVNLHHAGYAHKDNTIQDIHFKVNSGQIVGLIGPNGAGKSTTIKAIMGLLPDVHGEITFTGRDKTYAYIPEQPVLYEELTALEHLELAAAAYKIDRNFFARRVDELLTQFNLSAVRHHFPASFSKGMQQKLMIILGLLIQPEVYIIDEPFVGLDPSATVDFIELLEEEKAKGASVLISTHQLEIAERICSSIIMLHDGKLIAQGNLSLIQGMCRLPGASLFDCFKYILENKDDYAK